MQRILFLHSDPKLTGIYKRSLSNYFSVDSAFDGLEGLRMIKQSQPSLIVSDYTLPQISGISLLRFIRQHPQLHATPFIFFSHHYPTDEGLSLGATDWLVISQASPDILIRKCLNQLKVQANV